MAACLDSKNVTTYMGNVYINHGILAICLGGVYSGLNIFEEEISMVGCMQGHYGNRPRPRSFRAVSLLPTGSEEREVLGVGSIPVAILP